MAETDRPICGRRYDNGGGAAGVTTLTSSSGGGGGKSDRRITLAMVKDEGLGTAGNTAFVQVGQPKAARVCDAACQCASADAVLTTVVSWFQPLSKDVHGTLSRTRSGALQAHAPMSS